jgi:hypothetical protein
MEKLEENPRGSRELHLCVIYISQKFRSPLQITEQYDANRFYEPHFP